MAFPRDGDDLPSSSLAVATLTAGDAVDPEVDIDGGGNVEPEDGAERRGEADASTGPFGAPCVGPFDTTASVRGGTSSIGASGGGEMTAVIVAGYHKPSSC